jgi:hypothetical protein
MQSIRNPIFSAVQAPSMYLCLSLYMPLMQFFLILPERCISNNGVFLNDCKLSMKLTFPDPYSHFTKKVHIPACTLMMAKLTEVFFMKPCMQRSLYLK